MHRTRTIATAIVLAAATIGGAVALAGSGSPTAATATPSTTTVVQPATEHPSDRSGSTSDVGTAIDAVAKAAAAVGAPSADAATAPASDDPSDAPTSGAPSSGGSADQPTPAAAPVHEIIPGGGTPPPPSNPSEPIGELDDDGPVPAGFDFVAPPAPQGTPAFDGPTGLAVAPSCSHQCISRGDAYARGFGALLVVETTVPTEMFISAIADLDGDGDYEETHFENTPHGTTKHLWALDHLQPGTTYHAMVAATDEDGHTSHAWGSFTTLSKRDVFISFGDLEIIGGPNNIDDTDWLMSLGGGPFSNVTPGQQGILLFKDLPRGLLLDFWVVRAWDCELPEVWTAEGEASHGHNDASCLAWNSATAAVDLDSIPSGQNHWTSTTVQRTLAPDAGDGALPNGYGDPFWFAFSVPVTLHVSYS